MGTEGGSVPKSLLADFTMIPHQDAKQVMLTEEGFYDKHSLSHLGLWWEPQGEVESYASCGV